MRHLHLLWIGLIGLSGLTGCEMLSNLTAGKETDPVMGPPPPRISTAAGSHLPKPSSEGLSSAQLSSAQLSSAQLSSDRLSSDKGDRFKLESGIQLVSRTEDSDVPNLELSGSKIVATVDRTPIFASEVWSRYAGRLMQIRRQATPEEYQSVLRELLQRDLKTHIENRLLVNAMRATIPKKKRKKLDEFMDQAFEEHVEKLKKEFKVDSKAAVDDKLAEQGTSLASLRDIFGNQQMARQFAKAKVKSKQIIGRPELMRYYNEHRADYRKPAEVRWQEIHISYDKHGGKEAALRVADDVIRSLKRGDDFGAVAKKSSDGPTAGLNGQWDWTRSESLADKHVERMLFELPVGEISAPYAGEHACKFVRINGRHAERFIPFAEVQNDIKKTLEEASRKKAAKKMIAELYKNAVITTVFDEEKRAKKTANNTTAANP